MIGASCLNLTRQLAGLALQQEREAQAGRLPNASIVSSELEALCHATSADALLTAIRLHRLEILLADDPLVLQLIPQLADRLKLLARKEHMAALALASLTREMAALFERAGLPMLVIKGVPLALQTTGSLTSRGRGDCDLVVNPDDLCDAITLLQTVGFVLCESKGARGIVSDSIYGHYSRFVGMEISLQRDIGGQLQWCDLHWQVSHARGVLPGFQALWRRHDELSINNQPISTLNKSDALLHSCCHAAMDRWMSIRSLVDIERLRRESLEADLTGLQQRRIVRKTIAVLSDCLILDDAERLHKHQLFWISDRAAIHEAHRSQLTVCREDESLMAFGLRHLRLSYSPVNWLVKLLLMLLPPDVLFHPSSGKPLPLHQVLVRRLRKLNHQMVSRR